MTYVCSYKGYFATHSIKRKNNEKSHVWYWNVLICPHQLFPDPETSVISCVLSNTSLRGP